MKYQANHKKILDISSKGAKEIVLFFIINYLLTYRQQYEKELKKFIPITKFKVHNKRRQ
jgi:hypothetical protein